VTAREMCSSLVWNAAVSVGIAGTKILELRRVSIISFVSQEDGVDSPDGREHRCEPTKNDDEPFGTRRKGRVGLQ
jgi:hypothetical protein